MIGVSTAEIRHQGDHKSMATRIHDMGNIPVRFRPFDDLQSFGFRPRQGDVDSGVVRRYAIAPEASRLNALGRVEDTCGTTG